VQPAFKARFIPVVSLIVSDAGDVLLEFVIVFRPDEILPALDGEHDIDVNLRVGIGHARKMPLLTELEIFFLPVLQRCRSYGAALKGVLTFDTCAGERVPFKGGSPRLMRCHNS
jgi:hypothetical protein